MVKAVKMKVMVVDKVVPNVLVDGGSGQCLTRAHYEEVGSKFDWSITICH